MQTQVLFWRSPYEKAPSLSSAALHPCFCSLRLRGKTLLNKKKPVSLSFWHVYGEQAGSPMDLLVQEFNRTVGQERGVQVKVTGMSSASQIGGYLKEAQSGGKGVQ